MSRKMMQREITFTSVRVAMIEVVEGEPKTKILPDEHILGNVSMEQAQKELNKRFGKPVTILGLEANTKVYEMPVEEFINLATVKETVI